MTTPLLGEIRTFGFNFAPRGWATCSGQTLSISQNTALFSLLGTTYGGNGTTNFMLPDLRGRVAVNAGTGPGLTYRPLGEVWGVESVTLSNTNLPTHVHPFTPGVATSSTTKNPAGKAPGPTTSAAYGDVAGTGAPQTTGAVGGGLPFATSPPSLALTICIALEGIFPSRN